MIQLKAPVPLIAIIVVTFIILIMLGQSKDPVKPAKPAVTRNAQGQIEIRIAIYGLVLLKLISLKKLVNFFFESIKLNPDYMHDYGFDSNYMCESAEGAQNAHGPGNGNAWSNINPLNEEKKKGNWADDAIKTFVKSMNNAKKEEDEVESSYTENLTGYQIRSQMATAQQNLNLTQSLAKKKRTPLPVAVITLIGK